MERRSLSRLELDAVVTIHREGSSEVWYGTLTDVNVKGVALTCQTRFVVGEVLVLELRADADRRKGTDQPITGTMQVARVQGTEPPFEVAGPFLELNLS